MVPFPIESPWFTYGILAVGLVLVLCRPYTAFMFVVFCATALSESELSMSHAGGLPFSGSDACLAIACLAMIADQARHSKRKAMVPVPVVGMIVVLAVAFLQTAHQLGFTYSTVRALRWALTLPVFFLIAGNLIVTESRAVEFLVTFFAGAFVASVRAVTFAAASFGLFLSTGNYRVLRTAGMYFITADTFLLLAMLVWPIPKNRSIRILYLSGGILFAISTVLSQWRSVWIAFAASIPVVLILYSPRRSLVKRLGRFVVVGIVVCIGSLALLTWLFPGFDVLNMIQDRLFELSDTAGTSSSRWAALTHEWQAWSEGSLILGRGLSYFQKEQELGVMVTGIAYNHLGHLTGLAQLGLVGFLVYSLYVPIAVVRKSRILFSARATGPAKQLAVLSGATMIFIFLFIFMNDTMLKPHIMWGVLAGSGWYLASAYRRKKMIIDEDSKQQAARDRQRIVHEPAE